MINSRGMSHTLPVGLLLALSGGFLDVYTYVCRDGVFANAQTGNMVLLGVSLVRGEFLHALYYVIPVLAFVIGIIISEMVRKRFLDSNQFHWRQIIIGVEIFALMMAGFMPQNDLNNIIVNITVSFVCSLQVESFRIINDSVLATTMCTGNLRSASELIYKYKNERLPEQKKAIVTYLSVIAFFILGAILGAVICVYLGFRAIFVPCVFLFAVFMLMFIKKQKMEK